MAKLQNYYGRFCESEYENTFLSFLEEEHWNYLSGISINRSLQREVLYTDDLGRFLRDTTIRI